MSLYKSFRSSRYFNAIFDSSQREVLRISPKWALNCKLERLN